MYNPASIAIQNELLSDLWIEQNVVGGLNSKLINYFYFYFFFKQ